MEAAAAAAIRSLRLSSSRDRRGLNPKGPCAPLAIRVPRAAEEAAVAARADGTRAPEERWLGAAMTFPRPPRREDHKGGGAPWSPGGAQATFDSAPLPTGTGPSACHRATGPLRGGAGMAACTNRSASRVLGGASAEWPSPPPPPPRGLAPIRRRPRLRFHCQLKDAVSRAGLFGALGKGTRRFGSLPRVDPDSRSRRSHVPVG